MDQNEFARHPGDRFGNAEIRRDPIVPVERHMGDCHERAFERLDLPDQRAEARRGVARRQGARPVAAIAVADQPVEADLDRWHVDAVTLPQRIRNREVGQAAALPALVTETCRRSGR